MSGMRRASDGGRAGHPPGTPTPEAGSAGGMSRRTLLTRMAPLAALGVAAACGPGGSSTRGTAASDRPLALVYRGPAACGGCAEAAAALLESAPTPFRTAYCGPGERFAVEPRTLAAASLYVQPGGGDDLEAAWRAVQPFAGTLRDWIRSGGHYVGFCMGGFLAGSDPGFGILPGDSGEYVATPGATVRTDADALVTVRWGGGDRPIYFQGGPYFSVPPGTRSRVLGTYTNGLAAAMVARYGSGSVGVTGPHPEAPVSWYREADLAVPSPMPFDLGHDLIASTVSG